MKSKNSWRIRVAQILLGAVIVIALVVVRGAKAGDEHIHLVTDWSHRHLVYSAPGSLMQKFELSTHTRYVQQWIRRNAERRHDRDEWRWRHAPDGPNDLLHGDWSMDMGAGATVGAGNDPAKFSFDPTSANCQSPAPGVGQQPDFVVYNTGLTGSSSQASIVAFTNLYTSCTGGTPLTYWAYNTGLAGAVVTSPVLSFDGTQVAFVQNTSPATLVILRWKASTGTLASPVTPSSGSCTPLTTPCMTTITFSTANGDATATDTFSSPFYDYKDDTIYVGDDGGFLHKFTGVFLGTPAEFVSSTVGVSLWPAGSLTGGFGHLNSPVFDQSVSQALVTASDGVLYTVDATMGGVPATGFNETAKLAGTGFQDGPLVDLTTGMAYVFAQVDNATTVTAVIQVPVPATPAALHNATGTVKIVQTTTNLASALYNGAFDNAYYTSGGTGNLYTCGTSAGVTALWKIPIAAGVMGTPVVGPSLTSANVGCSPITEFQNGATDRMFLSVTGSPVTIAPISCPSGTTGCLMSFDITNTASWSSSTATSAKTSVTGGTSGIIIDNSSSAGGASQVYFTPLSDQPCAGSGGVGIGTGGCAIQASQSLLN